MSPPPTQQSEIINQLAEFAIKVLKPGGVSVGGLYGLYALFVQQEVATAIAAALIGFCVSYAGRIWEPIHQGNQRRLQGLGQNLDAALEDNLAKLLAKATRAEDAYLLCQALDCRDYKPEGMGARDRTFIPMLQEVFVPLELDTGAIPPGFKRRRLKTSGELPEVYIWNFLAQAQREPTYRQLAIIAWGGFGKTTLLKHLAYIYGTQQHRKYQVPFLVPILLPLRNYRQQFAADPPLALPELVMQHHVKALTELNPRLANLPDRWAQDILSQGKALVMFDGFDEIPEPERQNLSRWIQAQMRRFDRSIFILASRPKAYQESFTDPLRTRIWVRPFNTRQQTRFVTQWYSSQERLARGGRNSPEVQREANRNAQNLLSQIQDPQRPELADLAKNPLLLNLLATYHRSNPGVELPRQRAELYQDICALQLRKRPDARNIPLPLSPADRQSVLQAVALTMMQCSLRLISEAELEQMIAGVLQAQGQSVAARDFLNQIIDVSELIVRQGLEGCEFAHLSFQEFLAAAQIKSLNQESLLYPHLQNANTEWDDPWWRQTILLYAAQTNPTPLIEEALRQRAVDLAYACWAETQRTLDPEIAAELAALKPTLRISRYAKLKQLLQSQKWREANKETYRLMITTVGKEDGQWFDREDLLNFPCEDLKTIDQLWVKASEGKFGFSVQKQIYVSCGAQLNGKYPGDKIWDNFCDLIGWRKAGKYVVNYKDLQASLQYSPTGEFPGGGR
ncbi:MAG: NACHT domain-containing protein [Leptolyngbya sp. SIO1D8]|nr:NACHT domain-containing protein [Leptolyngbya sp. SIO1D8]